MSYFFRNRSRTSRGNRESSSIATMAILEDYPKATGAPRHPAAMDPAARGHRRHRVSEARSRRLVHSFAGGVLNENYFPPSICHRFATCSSWSPMGRSFFDEERRDIVSETEYLCGRRLGAQHHFGRPPKSLLDFEGDHRRARSCCPASLTIDTRFETIRNPSLASPSSICVARPTSGGG